MKDKEIEVKVISQVSHIIRVLFTFLRFVLGKPPDAVARFSLSLLPLFSSNLIHSLEYIIEAINNKPQYSQQP